MIAKRKKELHHAFPMLSTANPEDFLAGALVTATAYSKTGAGAWTLLVLGDSVSEIGVTGIYEITLSSDETNFDKVCIKFTSENAADQFFIWDFVTTADLVDEIYAEDPADHTTADTFGKLFNEVPTLTEVRTQVDNGLTDYDAATGTELALVSATLSSAISNLNDPSLIDIINGVLDTDLITHSSAGSLAAVVKETKSGVNNLSTNVPDWVWNAQTFEHQIGGSFGKVLVGQVNITINPVSSLSTLPDLTTSVSLPEGAGRPDIAWAVQKQQPDGSYADYDLTGKTVRLVVYKLNRGATDQSNVLLEVDSDAASLTILTNTVTLDLSAHSAAVAVPGNWDWALWEIDGADGDQLLGSGEWFVNQMLKQTPT